MKPPVPRPLRSTFPPAPALAHGALCAPSSPAASREASRAVPGRAASREDLRAGAQSVATHLAGEHTGAEAGSSAIDAHTAESLSEAEAAEHLWAALLASLEARLSLFVFRGFLQPLLPVRLDAGLLTLAAPSAFHRDWIRDHYAGLLEEEARALLALRVRVSVIHEPRLAGRAEAASAPAPTASHRPPALRTGEPDIRHARGARPVSEAPAAPAQHRAAVAPPASVGFGGCGAESAPPAAVVPFRSAGRSPAAEGRCARLNADYTFGRFVSGATNRMALAACQAVAEHPARTYSPLFLFGGVGLGKTHLLHAIGNDAQARHPGLRVVYMSAEEWVNEYIQEIRHQRFDAFRRRYRSGCDLLLLDDIQFLAGKDASQDEFFHTFNSLYESNRQIVVTSDRYPHEIEGLEERLKTRLQWGLIADIQPPDLETRTAILRQKAAIMGIALDADIEQFLAMHIQRSVRELEGALVRLQAFAMVTRAPLTLAEVRSQLGPMLGQREGSLTLERIIQLVASYYDLRPSDLRGPGRQRQVARARQVAMYLARQHTGASLPEIGRGFGGRDHTTVLTSVRKVDGLRRADAAMQAVLHRLERALLGREPTLA